MRVRTELCADRGHPGHVLLDIATHLDLEMPDALVREHAGILRHVRRRLDGQDAERRELANRWPAEQIAYRHAEPASLQVVQCAIEPGFGPIVSKHDSVEIIENACDLPCVASDQALAKAVERALHGFMRSPIMIHRGGVAAANRVMVQWFDPRKRGQGGSERPFVTCGGDNIEHLLNTIASNRTGD